MIYFLEYMMILKSDNIYINFQQHRSSYFFFSYYYYYYLFYNLKFDVFLTTALVLCNSRFNIFLVICVNAASILIDDFALVS